MKNEAPRAVEKAHGDRLVFRGRVLDPEGKPVDRAQILLGRPLTSPDLLRNTLRLGTSGTDGRFEVSIARETIDRAGRSELGGPVIAAFTPGLGPDWVAVDPASTAKERLIRLRRDDVPIEGRIIGLEGRPIPGLVVSLGYIADFLPGVLAKLRENAGKLNPELWGEMRNVFIPGREGPLPAVAIGPDGRFRLTGVGRDRGAVLVIEGASIEQALAMVVTTSDAGYTPIPLPGEGERLLGPRFELTVAPGRVIEGAVRDRDTREPIAGARVRAWGLFSTVTTDAQGRFRLTGQPKGRENGLEVEVDQHPYIKVAKPVPDPSGLGPIWVDFSLERGVWVEGKVTNRANGRPVKAVVEYFPFRDNPRVPECPDATFSNNHIGDETEFPTDADGRFRAVALPGGDILTVRTQEPGYVYAQPLAPAVAGNVLCAKDVDFRYLRHSYQALIPIDPPAVEKHTIPDITLAPGRIQHLQVLDPDGRPVVGAKGESLQEGPSAADPASSSELTFINANPGKAETVVISQADRSLGAFIDLKGDEPDPIKVTLQPAGTVIGRLVAEDGHARPNVPLIIMQQFKTRGGSMSYERFDPVSTGPDGRFRIKNLVPGFPYTLQVVKKNEPNFSLRAEGYLHASQWTIKPGEIQDWGDVQVQTDRP